MENYKKCKVESCENNAHWRNRGRKGYCKRHYTQINRHRKILGRTRYDPNEIIDCGEYYEICLYSGLGEQKEIVKTKIDKEDLKKVKNYKWGLNNKGYTLTRINKKNCLFLHHLVFGYPPIGYEVDHRDTDPLNNRKSNLRFVTHSQNNMNRKNVRGYYWNKKSKKWHVKITVNKQTINLGYFVNKQDAKRVAKEARQKYHGKFAYNKNN